MKVNVDGACNPDGGASACAGVVRDYKGKVRGDFLFNMGRGDCYVAVGYSHGIKVELRVWC